MKTFTLFLLLIVQFNGRAQQGIQQNDFSVIAGTWKGTLTYLDYTSNDTVHIPANTLIELTGTDGYDQYIFYTEEPDKNKKTRYVISEDGQRLNNMVLKEKKRLPDGSLQLLLESSGEDGNDNKPAWFRHILILGPRTFSITKLVSFEGKQAFFQRHKYSFSR